MRLVHLFRRDENGSLVVNVGKASIAIAFLSVIAANWLAAGVNEMDKAQLSQLAANASKNVKNGIAYFDPTSTGSLQKRAGDTRLDPCVLPAKR